jgi:hypothetical protein
MYSLETLVKRVCATRNERTGNAKIATISVPLQVCGIESKMSGK